MINSREIVKNGYYSVIVYNSFYSFGVNPIKYKEISTTNQKGRLSRLKKKIFWRPNFEAIIFI